MIPRASTWSAFSGKEGEDGAKKAQTGFQKPVALSQEQHGDVVVIRSLPPQQEHRSTGSPITRHAQPTNSISAVADSEKTMFQLDIHIFDGTKYRPGVALVDTMCQAYMCISQRLVERLGMADQVSKDELYPRRLEDASGNDIGICGFFNLEWKIFGGQTVHSDKCLVLRPTTFDVIIGVGKIADAKLIRFDKDALKPMIAHNTVTLGEKAMMAIREEEQRQEKAALETQRLKPDKGKQQSIAQSSRG